MNVPNHIGSRGGQIPGLAAFGRSLAQRGVVATFARIWTR